MSPARTAWAGGALAAVLVPAGLVLNTIGGEDKFFIYVVFQLFFAGVQLTTACVGVVLASRLPANRVGWVLLAISLGARGPAGRRRLWTARGERRERPAGR